MKTTDLDMYLWCLIADETTAESWRREVDDRADRADRAAELARLVAECVAMGVAS